MWGTIWVTDREPGMRLLFRELLPDAEVVMPEELPARILAGPLPDAIVVDGTQLLTLAADDRERLLGGCRVLVCTGLSLTSIPMTLVSGPDVTVLAKPFSVNDLEEAVAWLRVTPTASAPRLKPLGDGRPPGSGASGSAM